MSRSRSCRSRRCATPTTSRPRPRSVITASSPENGVVTVVTDDRPGVFSRVAGVLALRGLDVLEAVAYSTPDGQALSRFRVDRPTPRRDAVGRTSSPTSTAHWRVGWRSRHGSLIERVSHARRRRLTTSERTTVTFDNAASDDATVIDVEAPDAIGVLYRITKALTDLDLDIRSAKVQTLGAHVVDAFYVRDRSGQRSSRPR